MTTMPPPHIVFFDMEGTLLQKEHRLDDGLAPPSAWTLLAEALGPECYAEEQESKKHYNAKRYANYLEWMNYTVAFYQRFKLTHEIFQRVIDSIKLMPNAEPALQRIHERGAKSVLITGGFKALADRVQRRLKIHHALAGCEFFFNEAAGSIEHVNLLPADERGKADFMRLMCREYDVAPEECAFVGDGRNDTHLAREVGFSVAFNAQPELAAVTTVRVDQTRGSEDFTTVADLIDKHFPLKSN
jgi:phosphoserine phosphatase